VYRRFAEKTNSDVPLFVALVLGSASLGYFLGRGTRPSAGCAAINHEQVKEPATENRRVIEDPCDSDESDAEADGDLGRIQPEPADECKLVSTSLRNCPFVLARLKVTCGYGGA